MCVLVKQQVPEPKPINSNVPVKGKLKQSKSGTSAENVCNKDQVNTKPNLAESNYSVVLELSGTIWWQL